jgi:putative aldouronate transport system substrate-binding protein
VPYNGAAKPDVPAGEHGVPAGYYHFPADPQKFLTSPPGKGGDVSFILQGTAIAVPEGRNKWWQAINQAVNANLKINAVNNAGSSTTYEAKVQTTIAGGDLPDVMQLIPLPRMPEVLESEFEDLTPYLAGDAIKEYPGLASIPTATWQIPTLNGKIWGVAQPRPAAGQSANTRGDLLKQYGIDTNSPALSSGQDFLDLCKAISDPKKNKYAMGEQPNTWVLNATKEMCSAPNNWKEEGGKFTSVNETDEMKDALDLVVQMWNLQYIHPSSFATPENNYVWWRGGTTTIFFQSFVGWTGAQVGYPTFDVGVLTLPKWDGGGAAPKILGVAGYGAYVSLKKAKPERIKELLGIINFIAAPFGTQEFLTVNYGVKDVDYKLNGPDPVQTDQGKSEVPGGLGYCGAQGAVNLYVPGNKELVDAEHKYLTSVLPTGVPDPTWGLYSETASTKGATADKNLRDVTADIIQGRKKMSDWDSAVQSWLKAAGEAERQEYEKAFAAANG